MVILKFTLITAHKIVNQISIYIGSIAVTSFWPVASSERFSDPSLKKPAATTDEEGRSIGVGPIRLYWHMVIADDERPQLVLGPLTWSWINATYSKTKKSPFCSWFDAAYTCVCDYEETCLNGIKNRSIIANMYNFLYAHGNKHPFIHLDAIKSTFK